MRKFLVTRTLVTDLDGGTVDVNFDVMATTGPEALRFADNAKRAFEAERGVVAPVSDRESVVGDHLTFRPFANLPGGTPKVRKVSKRKARGKVRKVKANA